MWQQCSTACRLPALPPRSVGLKGMDPANVEKLESLIFTKLEELEKSGFSPSAVEAAVNTIEFRCGWRLQRPQPPRHACNAAPRLKRAGGRAACALPPPQQAPKQGALRACPDAGPCPALPASHRPARALPPLLFFICLIY